MSVLAQWLPDRLRSLGRKARSAVAVLIHGRYDLPAVVAPKSRASRWLATRLGRVYVPPSMVSRRSGMAEWAAVKVRGELPTLYHFDIHVTDHCNLNCKGCIHFSSLCEPRFVDPEQFADDMRAMAEKLRVEQIYLLGGEPLLHPRIAEFLASARECFPKTRICLVTNGLLLMKMGGEFWQAMADSRTVLLCAAYPISLPTEDISQRAEEYGVELEWVGYGEFFKLPIDSTGSQNAKLSFDRCSGITNCPLYKDGRLYPCAYPAYVDAFSSKFELPALREVEADSISVRDNDSDSIIRFLQRPVPFCRYCDFDHFEEYEWGRSAKTIDEWTVKTGEPRD